MKEDGEPVWNVLPCELRRKNPTVGPARGDQLSGTACSGIPRVPKIRVVHP